MAHHIDIQHTAKLARLKLTEQEAVKYEAQLAKVLDYMETLEGHDLSGVELTAHAMPIYDVWREDVSVEGLDRDEALSNAPRKTAGQFLISRVVE
ncbi:Asp-tRNA(Asn)/Glu-tRNA(Gln) amidotransferase subunit GatC [Verrucomicrobium sp. BvORR106]|uniref:Asp-tRNA(Asn)/Glu-tRNA(Gln) amidotransferase subunit GatC n=1 Tax=Verrucomicrobium sp. BvORR106 TaxID=1403819 RepID=UPI0005711A05|nr:Asp-tRNA(Asn)/Glu-tRNA(Gln) amidotransferase subunit GatC [Verrucomicrobium sp. BvORR106]